MTNPLSNDLVRIAVGSALAAYLTPKVINRYTRPELNEHDERVNTMTAIGITSATVTLVYIVLGMATGKSVAGSVAGASS
jgi:hypothetical protein